MGNSIHRRRTLDRVGFLPPYPLPTLSTHQPHNIHRVLSREPGRAAPALRVRRRRGAGISRLRWESGRRPLTPTAGEAGLRLLGATALGRFDVRLHMLFPLGVFAAVDAPD